MAKGGAEKVLLDLHESASEARAHWQAWWAIAHQSRPYYTRGLAEYPSFFAVAERGHFNSLIINLAHLFDRRRDVSSIERYLKLAKATARDANAVLSELRTHTKAREAVLEIRNSVIAHKNAGLTEEEVFSRARISPRDIRDLVDAATSVVNQLLERAGLAERVFTDKRVSLDTLKALESMERA